VDPQQHQSKSLTRTQRCRGCSRATLQSQRLRAMFKAGIPWFLSGIQRTKNPTANVLACNLWRSECRYRAAKVPARRKAPKWLAGQHRSLSCAVAEQQIEIPIIDSNLSRDKSHHGAKKRRIKETRNGWVVSRLAHIRAAAEQDRKQDRVRTYIFAKCYHDSAMLLRGELYGLAFGISCAKRQAIPCTIGFQ
jgi:hypothetical protein